MPTIQAGCELDVDRGPNWLFVKIGSPGDEADILCLADQVWALLDRAFLEQPHFLLGVHGRLVAPALPRCGDLEGGDTSIY